MAEVTLGGNPVHTIGELPEIGTKAPDFALTASNLGEITRDTALPWFRIQPTRFRAEAGLDSEIGVLRTHQAARAADDPNFRYLVGDVNAFREINSQKSVSLNLTARQAENKAIEQGRLDRENTRRAALGLKALTGVDQLDSAELPETILLKEASRVVAEMAEIAPPHSRQLLSGGSEGNRKAAQPQ